MAIYKYSYYTGDANEEIIEIERLQDPSYLANDWHVNNLVWGFSVTRYYSMIFAFLSNLLPLWVLYLVSYLSLSTVILLSIYAIGKIMYPGRLIGYLSVVAYVALFWKQLGSLGKNRILTVKTIPNLFAGTLVITAIYYFLKGKHYRSFLLLGAATIFHPSISLGSFLILMAVLTLRGIAEHRIGIKKISVMIMIYVIPSSIIIGPILFTPREIDSDPGMEGQAMEILAFYRAPWHFSASSWSVKTWFKFFVVAVPLVVILVAFSNDEIKNVRPIIFFVLFFAVIQLVFTEVVFRPEFVKLGLYRPTFLIPLFAAIISAGTFLKFSKRVLPRVFQNGYDSNIRSKTEYWAKLLLVISVFLLGFVMILQPRDFTGPVYEDDMADMFDWIRVNTDPQDVFLVPPMMDDFRLGCDRAIVVNFKCIPYDDASLIQWYERMMIVTNNLTFPRHVPTNRSRLDEAYHSLEDDDFVRIANDFDAEYIVVNTKRNLPLKKLYENQGYMIYLAESKYR